MSVRPLPPSGYHPPKVEDCDESSSEDSDAVDDTKAPANVGSKRSDPPIVNQKKYATSDSGYSSLTTTTASSSKSKTQGQAPAAVGSSSTSSSFKKKLASVIRKPAKEAPLTERRMSRKNEVPDLRFVRNLESTEEARRMKLSGPILVENQRSPAYASGMPGAFPPSPKAVSQQLPLATAMPIPGAVPRPRPRTNSTTYYYRPVSLHNSGSLPSGNVYQFATPQQQAMQVEQYAMAQPLYVNTAPYTAPADQFVGQAPYVPTPTSSSPAGTPGFGYTPTNQTYYPPPPQPQTQPRHQAWHSGSYGYSSTPNPMFQSRRTSMNASVDYSTMGMQYPPPPPPQIHYNNPQQYPGQVPRQYSRTVDPSSDAMYRPPPPPLQAPIPQSNPLQTPVDEGVFMEDYEDYYRLDSRPESRLDRIQMPPPPRPQSSHPHRPPMPHSRTTSAAAVHASHRRSLEYAPNVSPRKPSFESRPPSRPGMIQRYSSTSSSSSRAHHGHIEPASPVRRRHTNSVYGQADLEKISSAEAYQTAKTGGYQTNVTQKDLPPLARRPTKNSETSSKGSSGREGSDGKHNKRVSRHSLDKQHLREAYEREGYTVNLPEGVSVNTQGGSLTIKRSRDGEGGMQLSFGGGAANVTTSRPPSRAKPTREPSRVRSGGKKYITEGSSHSNRSREKAEYEVNRQRRGSSIQPNIGIDDITGPLKRLDLNHARSRQSRSSSRSGRTHK